MPTQTNLTHVWRPSLSRRVVLDGFGPIPRGTTQTIPAPLSWPAKDPSDVLDYEFDISTSLTGNEGDAISSIDVTVTPSGPSDLVVNSVSADGAVVVVWFSGGTAGVAYVVKLSIGTTSGRSISRVVLLPCLGLASTAQSVNALTTNQGSIITDQFGNPILLGS